MGVRARSFAERLGQHFCVSIAYRQGHKAIATANLFGWLRSVSPDLVYVLDLAASGVGAALAYRRLTGTPVVIDTGDAITALAEAMGRSPMGQWLTEKLESTAIREADAFVVRSTNHRPLLLGCGARDVEVVPDGVDTRQFYPRPSRALRRRLGLKGCVIGTLGSSQWSPTRQSCYGWELPDVLHALRDRNVSALLVGNGDGVARIQQKAAGLGVADRLVCTGAVPYDELPEYLCTMDIALSKQTNDLIGQVRTTGKLPLYLACGRFVLATRVGEAANVLPPAMLMSYAGSNDPTYTDRLSKRIRELVEDPARMRQREKSAPLARRHFEYNRLASRVEEVCTRALTR